MRGITKRFGGTVALSEVDFEVLAGEIHGLVGQNGAGKSTLMKIVAGDYRPDSGRIFVDGDEVEIRDPRRGLDLGVGIVYQELSLLPNLTVAENISLGREQTTLAVVGRETEMQLAGQALALLGIDHIRPGVRVNRLTVAEQQLVEIAKVLSLGPRILALDEPTAALSLHDARRLFTALRHLGASGVGIVFVSHRYGEVLEILRPLHGVTQWQCGRKGGVGSTEPGAPCRADAGRGGEAVASGRPGAAPDADAHRSIAAARSPFCLLSILP